MKKYSMYLSLFLICNFFINSVYACTDIRIIAKDGTILIARSMEFAADMKSNLHLSSQLRSFKSITPDGKSGLAWKAKYGYLFLDGLGIEVPVDGMNEAGLSFEYLFFPGETEYQKIPSGQENRAVSYLQFGDWVLGNFKTVSEVRQALEKIVVFAQPSPVVGNLVLPVHASIYDASGKGIVVEFVKGKVNIYENKLGVMTNSPAYDWHLTNLRNYLNLTPFTPEPIVAKGITFASTGQGSGMVGLPGDISPPSRFVKMAIMLQTVFSVADSVSALNLAEHIINNVDIPLGFVRTAKTGAATNEYTQWVVFKDLTHKNFYYRTYKNLTLRSISLDRLNFKENAPLLKMSMNNAPYVEDMTSQFIRGK